MKTNRIVYRVTTGIVSFMMVFSAVNYIINPKIAEAFTALGYPGYFRIELAIAKVLGALVLIIPAVSARFKEWAYAGFGIVFISAAIAHAYIQGAAAIVAPLIFMVLLVVSYVSFHRLQQIKTA